MNNFSTTQASNLGAILGVIMLLLNYFKIQITQEEIQILLGGILAVGSILLNWWHRFSKGDLTLVGFRHDTKL